MQRRAAVAYVAFFLVIAAGSYAFIATAEDPEITISGDNVEEIEEGDVVRVGDRTYTVTGVTAEVEGGDGHGGGGEIAYEITFAWTNTSARYTETWDANSTVEWNDNTWRVLTENDSPDVEVRWEPTDAYSPSWTDGNQYVDGDPDEPGRQDVPIQEFIRNSDNSSHTYANISQGDVIDYKGNESTVETVSNTSIVLAWTGPKTNTVSASNNQNVTLNDQPYVVHFENNDTVLLGQGADSQQQLQTAINTHDRFIERINGFWAVFIVAATALVLLVALAFLPRKE